MSSMKKKECMYNMHVKADINIHVAIHARIQQSTHNLTH